jgi:hypothetical protein
MKNTALSVICSCYFIATAGAQDVPTSLPVQSSALDFIAKKSPCTVEMTLQGINPTGGLTITGMTSNNLAFNSYNDFMSFVGAQTSRQLLFIHILCGNIQNIKLDATMTYSDFDTNGSLVQKTGITITDDISNQSLATFSLQGAQVNFQQTVFIPVSGISSAVLIVGTNPPTALTTVGNNGVMFDTKTLDPSQRMRVEVTFSDGSQAIYTQTSTLITQPRLYIEIIPPPPTFDQYTITNQDQWYQANSAWYNWYYLYYGNGYNVCAPYYSYTLYPTIGIDYNNLYDNFYGYYSWYYWQVGTVPELYEPINILVDRPDGSDLILQSSTNMVDWTTVAILPWDSSNDHAMFPVDGNAVTGNFFRAVAY